MQERRLMQSTRCANCRDIVQLLGLCPKRMQTLSYFSRPDADGLSGSAELDNIWNQLKKLRYDVFAKELQQYPENLSLIHI